MRHRDIMIAAGHASLEVEWWHFCLADEPYPDTFFDSPVNKASGS